MRIFEFKAIKNDVPFEVGGLKTFEDVLAVARMAESAGFNAMTVTEIDPVKGSITLPIDEAIKTISGTVPNEIIYTKEGKLREEVKGYVNSTGALI